MERILVIGCPGGGKTTFARKLSIKLNIPLHHLDAHFWKENWTPTPQDEFRAILKKLMEEPQWIVDGNYSRTIDIRIASADAIILFDFSKVLNLWRTLRRYVLHFGTVRPEMGGGNRERIAWKHIKYIITFPRKTFAAKVTALSAGKNLVVLHNPREAQNFLDNL